MSKSFSKIFNKFTKSNNIYCGKILKVKIISINKNFILVDSYLKSESKIPIDEFLNNDNVIDVKIGDIVEAFLDSIEDGHGQTILSIKKAKIHKSWSKLGIFFKNESIIKGEVIEKVKGGFIILIENLRGFLPGSLIDFKSMNSDLKGKNLELKIIKLDKNSNNIILSRKAVIQLENSSSKEEFLKNLKSDDIIKGVVKNITDYGAFIDLGFVDGLLHITDITWKRIKHPSEIVQLGEEINVKVLNFDKSSSKVSLGLKQLTLDPWINIYNKYPKYTKIFGKITNLTDYGFFVEIENGIEGLVHVSEIDWKFKNIHPSKIVKQNEKIEVMILDINIDNRRISLGLKQCRDNPWKTFYKKYKIGENITGIIKSITDFGIFVELENGIIDGLIHISDVEWSLDPKIDLDKYKKGNKILTKILQIDIIKLRISLGLKQLSNDPFNEFVTNNKKNTLTKGTIYLIENNKFLVKINDYILGEIINFIDNIFLKKNHQYLFKIIDFNYKDRLVNLKFNEIEYKKIEFKKNI